MPVWMPSLLGDINGSMSNTTFFLSPLWRMVFGEIESGHPREAGKTSKDLVTYSASIILLE